MLNTTRIWPRPFVEVFRGDAAARNTSQNTHVAGIVAYGITQNVIKCSFTKQDEGSSLAPNVYCTGFYRDSHSGAPSATRRQRPNTTRIWPQSGHDLEAIFGASGAPTKDTQKSKRQPSECQTLQSSANKRKDAKTPEIENVYTAGARKPFHQIAGQRQRQHG